MAGERDRCVVDSEPLVALVSRFVSDWSVSRDGGSGGRYAAGQPGRVGAMGPLSALDWLAAETQMPRGTIANLIRRPRNRTTELRVADAIVTAIGHPEAFHDGTLEVRQNPNVSSARRPCCGGSLTGEA